MIINTRFFGEVTIDDATIINFPEGIPAFDKETRFVLMPLKDGSPFTVLQSVQTAELGFMMTNPFTFKADYSFDIPSEDEKTLGIKNEQELLIYSILTLKDSLANSTMNLLAPIIINSTTQKGMQLVLPESSSYQLRYPIQMKEGSVG